MFCTKCGTQINDDAMFCPGCGASTKTVDISSTSEEHKTHQPISEVHILAEKPPLSCGNIDYYVYIDDVEYKCSSKSKEPIIIKVTPEVHIIEASLNKKSSTKKLKNITNTIGDAGLSGNFGSLGTIVGIASSITSKIVPSALSNRGDVTSFNSAEKNITTFKLSLTPVLNKIVITEID